MNIYTIRLSEQQLKIVQDAIDHLVEVDLEYMEYSDADQEEATLLQGMFKTAEPGDVINEFGL